MAPEHTIDLTLPPDKRLLEIGELYRDDIQLLLLRTREEVKRNAASVSNNIMATLLEKAAEASASNFMHTMKHHPYTLELQGLAKAANLKVRDLFLGNILYDLVSLSGMLDSLIGCTGFVYSGAVGSPNLLARAMDWNLPSGIGKLSAVFRYQGEQHEFLSVGFPGVTGVISGLSSRGFAIAVNQRFQEGLSWPTFNMPVLWLVRSVLEEAQSYTDACGILSESSAFAPAYYLLCGAYRGQARLVQSDGDADDVIHVPEGKAQCVANHDVDEEEPEEVGQGSSEHRYGTLKKRVERISEMSVTSAKRTLAHYPVMNSDTVHQMVILPEQGEIHLACPQRDGGSYKKYMV